MTTAPVLKTNLGYNNDIVISKIMNTDKSNADLDLRI